ncbi:hypothetical protein FO519_003911 [Halicephalobus sp. NKZ332]|nr:hypothetical protein FO519_003911 [Halicephalobus sp. NKZ332]
MDDIIFFVGIPVTFAVISYYIYQYLNSGLIAPVEVTEVESVPVLDKTTTLFYKHHIGSYSEHTSSLKELISLLPQGASTVQILYDDESTTPSKRLQSAIGCVFGEEGEDYYTQNYNVQLKRFGYERLVLKPSGKALYSVSSHNQSFFSRLNVNYRIRPLLKSTFHSLENKPETMVIIQVVDTSKNLVHVFIPLENIEEFIDAQHLSQDELDGKLARKRFDSDEESSESEPEISDREISNESEHNSESEASDAESETR